MNSDSISFIVSGLPPKKDGANSMWNKQSQRPRLIELRKAAVIAMGNRQPFKGKLHLKICIYADLREGDLDNFIAGICDGLMAAQMRTPIEPSHWVDLSEAAQPAHAIMFVDDSSVTKIEAERFPLDSETPHYKVEIICLE